MTKGGQKVGQMARLGDSTLAGGLLGCPRTGERAASRNAQRVVAQRDSISPSMVTRGEARRVLGASLEASGACA